MATTASLETSTSERRSIGVVRLAITAAITAVAVFILCWLGTFVPFSSPTHAYISLFTLASVSTLQALAEGALWSLVFGALVGALFAVAYNETARFDSR